MRIKLETVKIASANCTRLLITLPGPDDLANLTVTSLCIYVHLNFCKRILESSFLNLPDQNFHPSDCS